MSVYETADESADCIESCGLVGDELRLYLALVLAEFSLKLSARDMDAMREALPLDQKRYQEMLEKGLAQFPKRMKMAEEVDEAIKTYAGAVTKTAIEILSLSIPSALPLDETKAREARGAEEMARRDLLSTIRLALQEQSRFSLLYLDKIRSLLRPFEVLLDDSFHPMSEVYAARDALSEIKTQLWLAGGGK